MSRITAWMGLHKVLTVIFALWALMWIAASLSDGISGSSIAAALIFILPGVLVVWLIGKGFNRQPRAKAAPPTVSQSPQTTPLTSPNYSNPGSTGNAAVATAPALRPISTKDIPKRSADNQRQLSQLDSNSRITASNALKVDETVLVVLPSSRSSLVVTDQRLLFVPPGKNGFQNLRAIPFIAVELVWVDPKKTGGVLNIEAQSSISTIELKTPADLDRGMQLAQDIRGFSHAAKVTQQEQAPPAGESAFAETAHRAIPGASKSVSTLTLGDMLMMTPGEFEQFTGKALEAMGYRNMQVVGGSGDLAADLTGFDPQGRTVVVQCKRYAPGNRVGSPALQQFIGMKSVHHSAERGIFVTSADYSVEAVNLAQAHGIVLIDGDDLVKIAALLLAQGAIAPEAISSQSTSSKFCHECGEKIRSIAHFCPMCGSKTDEPLMGEA